MQLPLVPRGSPPARREVPDVGPAAARLLRERERPLVPAVPRGLPRLLRRRAPTVQQLPQGQEARRGRLRRMQVKGQSCQVVREKGDLLNPGDY